MKKFLIALMLACTTVLAFAEASFDQIQTLIEQRQYAAAASGLEGIIKNHPNSAKAFYAMSQAQAGLGNLEKARYALDKAKGLDPELKFATKGNIESLQTAITPQAAKIEAVHEHDYAWLKWVLALGVLGLAVWYHKSEEAKKKEKADREKAAEDFQAWKAKQQDTKVEKSHEPKPAPAAQPAQSTYVPPAPTYVPPAPSYAPSPTQTVIHHHSSSNDGLVTGMMIGQMMGHNDHHHDTTRVIEREVIREVPAPSRDSSWDTPSTPSRSSSWDDSSSKSSSWDSGSSSRSSSWDSDSSSSSSWGSSSSSSSSWDSGSSDSGSSSSSD